MHQGKYVFAQITEFLPRRVFDRIVQKYHGNKHTRTFTCWNQVLCMVFGQLTNRDSLRDLIVALDAHKAKSYHLGLGSGVNLPTLARANIRRNYRICEEFAYHLIDYRESRHLFIYFSTLYTGTIIDIFIHFISYGLYNIVNCIL